MSIYNARKTDGDDNGDEEENGRAASPFEMVCRKNSGFISLQNFFNTAANRNLAIFGQGSFPTEIYAQIISDTDDPTHNVCAKVSRTFRELCQNRFSFSKDFSILKFSILKFVVSPDFLNSPNQSQRQFYPHLADVATFTFQDWRTGEIMQSELDALRMLYKAYPEDYTTWCPVVGGVARPSMMTQFQLRLELPI